VKWVIEVEGGPVFPANAAAACGRAALGEPVGDLAELFMRLQAALAAARTDEPVHLEDVKAGAWPDFDPGWDG